MIVRLVSGMFWLVTVSIGVLIGWLYLRGLRQSPWNFYSNEVWAMAYAGAGVTSIIAARQESIPPAIRQFLLWSSVGMFFYTAAQTVWTYYNVVLGIESPTGFWGDLLYLSIYFFLAAGLVSLLTFYAPILTRRMIIETLGIVIICFSFLLWLIIEPILQNPGTVAQFLVNIAYPIGDSIITSFFFLLLRLAGGKMQRGIVIFLLGLIFLACGDSLYILRDRQGIYWNGDISDDCLALAGIFFWAGTIETIKGFLHSAPGPVSS